MKLSDLTLEVRDKDYNRVGQITAQDMDLTAGILFNDVGTWQVNVRVDHPCAATLRQPGSGIIVSFGSTVLFSGPMTSYTYTASSDEPAGALAVVGATDNITLNDRLCYPQPSNADPTTQNVGHYTTTGPVETVMHDLVNKNLGPGAATLRRNPKLSMGPNGARGTTLTKKMRFQVLGSALRDLGLVANLGFRVVHTDHGVQFQTYPVADKTALIRLDVFNQTISSQSISITAPSATEVIVAGQGEDVARAFYLGTNATAQQAEVDWGRRIEVWRDQRQTDQVTEYASAANQILNQQGFTQVAVKLTPNDVASIQFGRDWGIGDKISVVIDNSEYVSVVTGLALKANNVGLQIGTVLGDPALLDDNAALLKRLLDTQARVQALETST